MEIVNGKKGRVKLSKKRAGIVIIVAALISVFMLCFKYKVIAPKKINDKNVAAMANNIKKSKAQEEKSLKNEKPKRSDETVTITSLGNIMFHESQIKFAKTAKGYDFKPSFTYLKDMVSSSDLSLAVFEGSFVNNKYQGYPLFRTPDEVADALKDCGVDVVNEASNHVFDGAESGMKRSRDVVLNKGMDVIGVKSEGTDKNYLIKDVKGYKIGLAAYTYETPKIKGHKSINGIPLTTAGEQYINTFNYDELDDFYSKIEKQINDMKKDGADYVIISIHWGDEYIHKPNSYQKTIASKLNELGVDIILGNHPHIIQSYETLTSQKGHKTFVIYGQGNTLSNQSSVLLKEPGVEDGYIVQFTLDCKDDGISIKDYKIIPIFLYREGKSGGGYYNRIVPIVQALSNIKKYNLNNSALNAAKQSLKRTELIIGTNNIK